MPEDLRQDIERIQERISRLRHLQRQERETGKASFEQLDLEDDLGRYVDVLEAMIAWHEATARLNARAVSSPHEGYADGYTPPRYDDEVLKALASVEDD